VVTCSLDIVIGAYLYTLPAEVEWLHTIYSDHVNESYSIYLDNVILNKRICATFNNTLYRNICYISHPSVILVPSQTA